MREEDVFCLDSSGVRSVILNCHVDQFLLSSCYFKRRL